MSESAGLSGAPGSDFISDMARLRSMTNDETNRLHTVSSEIDALKAAIATNHAEATPLRQGFEHLIGAYKAERDEFDVLKAAHEKTLRELGILSQVLNQLRGAVGTIMDKGDSGQKNEETIAQYEKCQEELRESQAQAEALMLRALEAEDELRKAKAQLSSQDKLKQTVSQLQDKLEEAKWLSEAEQAAHEQTKSSVKEMAVRMAKAEEAGAERQAQEMGERVAEAEREKGEMESKCQKLIETIKAEAREEVEDKKAQKKLAVEEAKASEQRLSSVHAELVSARDALRRQEDALKDLAKLRGQINRLELKLIDADVKTKTAEESAKKAEEREAMAKRKAIEFEESCKSIAEEFLRFKEMDVFRELITARGDLAKLQGAVEEATEKEKAMRKDNALLRLKLAKAGLE